MLYLPSFVKAVCSIIYDVKVKCGILVPSADMPTKKKLVN